jgi:phenylalanyl-tRNA synthetase alpha chain
MIFDACLRQFVTRLVDAWWHPSTTTPNKSKGQGSALLRFVVEEGIRRLMVPRRSGRSVTTEERSVLTARCRRVSGKAHPLFPAVAVVLFCLLAEWSSRVLVVTGFTITNGRSGVPRQQQQRATGHPRLQMGGGDPDGTSATAESTTTLSIEQVSASLQEMQQEFDTKLAAAETLAEIEDLRRQYLTKKSPVNTAMKYMKMLSADDKPRLGAAINVVKDAMEALITERKQNVERAEIERRMESERIDVTLPGTDYQPNIGHRHPLSMTMEKAIDIFVELGYDTVTACEDSPEIETDYNCFEALNCPKDHPARDMQDTFYLTEDREYLLRTHTSSVQIRQLQKRKPPLRIVAPGRVYRRDDIDATHSLVFHQVEILALEERGNLHLGHLKGTVDHFLRRMLGPNIEIRYRGSYFPFTEPSMEVDVFFRGRWLEVLGCGMVDPNVLEKAGIDPEKYTGFAAGFGVERFAMVIHEISDIREFYKNDKRFLDQFPFYYDDGAYGWHVASLVSDRDAHDLSAFRSGILPQWRYSRAG